MSIRFILKIVIRIVFLVLLIALALYFFYQNQFFTGLFTVLIVVAMVFELIAFLKKSYSDIHKTILSMQYEDFSLNIPENKKGLLLFNDLKRLYQKQKQEFLDQQSIQLIYENIINGLDFGVMILRKKEDEKSWNIYLMNDQMSKMLEVPKYQKWQFLKERLGNFAAVFEDENFKEFNKSIELSIDYSENQTFTLKTSKIKTYEYSYYIISLDSVQNIIEKKEKQAWYNLMQVISHELMNTLTPINSLVENMSYMLKDQQLNKEDSADMISSLKTIKKKTLHLMDFVENYRQLTNLPAPVKKQIQLKQLLAETLTIMKSLFAENNIKATLLDIDKRYLVNVDVKLMERVLVNILTNSLHALSSSSNKNIIISASQEQNRTFITIKDYGHGIETSIRDKVFIPFFTTREKGGGIGLTLAKSIIEAHGGYITFKSNTEETSFIITLIN